MLGGRWAARCSSKLWDTTTTFVASGHLRLNPALPSLTQVRFRWNRDVKDPKPGELYLRRRVHYPEKYTLKPVPYTNLAGRNPVTGHVVHGTLGGGIRWPLLWVDYFRNLPEGSPPLVEKVLEVFPEPTRTAHVALVGAGNHCRYIIATENMKPGDMITTSSELTEIAVRPNEGDAYPVGSLPVNTVICCVELYPGSGGSFARGAGTFCTILRKIGDRVIIAAPSKHEFSIEQLCVAVVGRVSNAIHNTIDIGSASNLRALGYRPRSGLWQRKTGKHGRKIKRPPPIQELLRPEEKPKRNLILHLTLPEYPYHKS